MLEIWLVWSTSSLTHAHIYIYIYMSSTDYFVLSELFRVARHAGRSKPVLKPVQLYIRLSSWPLSHHAGIGLAVSVRQWPRRPGFNPRSSHTKDSKKWYLMPPCLTLSIIRYGSRVKWSNPGKELRPPLHLGVVAIEKGAFGSPSTMVANFTYFTSSLPLLPDLL